MCVETEILIAFLNDNEQNIANLSKEDFSAKFVRIKSGWDIRFQKVSRWALNKILKPKVQDQNFDQVLLSPEFQSNFFKALYKKVLLNMRSYSF